MTFLDFLGIVFGWMPAPFPTILVEFLCLMVVWVVVRIIFQLFQLVLSIF